MAKKVLTLIKLQVPGGAANPAPPVGPALGQHGVNIMEFCKAFNAQTQDQNGRIIPVEITVFEDRSFTFITKTPPAAVLIKEAAGIEKGSGEPNREKVAQLTMDQVRQIAETKLAGPERARRRPGREDHRRHRALDGRGGEGLMAQARQALPRAVRARSTASAQYAPREAIQLVKELAVDQVRRDRRGPHPHRPERPPRRRAAARHDRVPERPRQGRDDRRLRQGRQGARGRGGRRRRRRRRGPGRADPGRLDRLRRGDRDAGHDAGRRPPGPRARAVRARCRTRRSARSRWTSPRPSRQSKAGRVEYRTDRTAIVHLAIGKASFDEQALLENYATLIDEIVRAKPAAAKGRYLRTITLATTMGPGVRVDPSDPHARRSPAPTTRPRRRPTAA